MSNNQKKIKVIIFVFTIVLLFFGIFGIYKKEKTAENNTNQFLGESLYLPKPIIPESNEIKKVEIELPEDYLIANFPFQTQAPLTNWDELHDEACEEASIILVYYFEQHLNLSAQKMNEEILKMVDWQMKNWQGHFDLTSDQTKILASESFGLKLVKKEEATLNDIKKEIFQNKPVIVPTAGRLLGNPNFRGAGPVYHMVVAIGYNQNEIIVQDVGTRNGKNYHYKNEIFYNAIHDWNNNPEKITGGQKSILTVEN